MQFWTIQEPVEDHYSAVNQMASGGSYVVKMAFRVIPGEGTGIHFRVFTPNSESWSFAHFVELGVHDFEIYRYRQRRPIASVEVRLTEMYIHPVDAKTRRFRMGGFNLMKQIFDAQESPIEIDETHEDFLEEPRGRWLR